MTRRHGLPWFLLGLLLAVVGGSSGDETVGDLIAKGDSLGAQRRLALFPEEASRWWERRGPTGKIQIRQLPLHMASIVLVDSLIAADPSACQARDHNGQTPLHCAASKSKSNITLLLQCFPNATFVADDQGKLPLHVAVSFPMAPFQTIKAIYQANPAAALQPDQDGALPIHLASWGATEGRVVVDTIRLLIEHDPTTLTQLDHDQETPLTIMVKYGRTTPEALRLVLEHARAPLDYRDDEGNTLLHLAARTRASLVKPLLEEWPAAARVPNQLGLLPLHAAVWKGCNEETEAILVDLLAVYPSATNVADASGYYPLHYASQESPLAMVEIVDHLLQIDSQIAAKAVPDGSLPLHMALRRLSVDRSRAHAQAVPRLFEAYPAAVRIPDPQLITHDVLFPLHVALLAGLDVSTIQQFVAEYPDALTVAVQPKTEMEGNATAWHLLAQLHSYSDSQTATLFQEWVQYKGIDLPDAANRLPLYYARGPANAILWKAYPAAAQALDYQNRTPLMEACRNKDWDSVTTLMEAYPQALQQPDSKGLYALHEACRFTNEGSLPSKEESNTMILRILEEYPTAAGEATWESKSYPLHWLCEYLVHVQPSTLERLVAAHPMVLRAKDASDHWPIHKLIIATLSYDSPDKASFVQGFEFVLRQQQSLGNEAAEELQDAISTMLFILLQAMDTAVPLRLEDEDPVPTIAQLLYQTLTSPTEMMQTDRRKRNLLHYGAVLMGSVGGALTQNWADFLEVLMEDLPSTLAQTDKEKRTPLHLLVLYLGDTAVGNFGDAYPTTKTWSPLLERLVEKILVAYPEALDLGERFDLRPMDLISHHRLQDGHAYPESPVIRNMQRLLHRQSTYWKFAQRLAQIETNSQDCHTSLAALELLEADICGNCETAPEGLGEFQCTTQQRHLCEMCPLASEKLAAVSWHLTKLATAKDNGFVSAIG